MRSIIRKPSVKKSFSAKTTNKVTRNIKKMSNSIYGKKGAGYIHNPKKALYNKVYKKTSIGIQDISCIKNRNSSNKHTTYSEHQTTTIASHIMVTNRNLPHLISEHPEIINILWKNLIKNLTLGILFLLLSILLLFVSPLIGAICIGIAIFNFQKSYKFSLAYNDAKKISTK